MTLNPGKYNKMMKKYEEFVSFYQKFEKSSQIQAIYGSSGIISYCILNDIICYLVFNISHFWVSQNFAFQCEGNHFERSSHLKIFS